MTTPDRLWLAVIQDYEWTSIHAAFTDEADARAYAEEVPDVDVQELDLFRAGARPPVTFGWEARAHAGRYRPVPPEIKRIGFSTYTNHVPAWVHTPCEVVTCETHAGGLSLCYRGGDPDAVLAACVARYDKAMAALA